MSSISKEEKREQTKALMRRRSTGSPELSLLENELDDDLQASHHEQAQSLQYSQSQSQSQQSKNTLVVRDSSHYVSTFAAGVGSGGISSMICAPLDLIRTRMQVWGDVGMSQSSPTQAIKEIIQKEGWPGMFRGLGATLVTVPLFWGVYFPLYDETKHTVATRYPEWHPSAVHCGSAVMTGAIADLICNPLFVVRTRLQTQALHQLADHQTLRQSSMVQTARDLYSAHGITVFWRGMTANLMGLAHVAIQFPTYEYLKKQARDQHPEEPETAMELLGASGLAKMCASLISYPHEVLRSRMMDSRAVQAPTLTGTIQHIWEQEGVRGYYRGLPVTLIRVIPNCCITFLSYEFLARWSKQQWNDYRQRKSQTVESLNR